MQSNSCGQLYATEVGCQFENSQDEQTVFIISAGQSSVTAYIRASQVGQLSLSAQTTAEGIAPAQKSASVTFTSFNAARGPNQPLHVMAMDPSTNKIYVGGDLTTWDDQYVGYVARLNTDGSRDTTFAPTGTGLNSPVYSIAVQSDGKVLVGGTFTQYDGATSTHHIARLNIDGSLDTSFAQTATGFNGTVYSIIVQSDGNILVGGAFTSYHLTARPYAARLNSDGSLDGSFVQTGTGLSSFIQSMALQNDGRIVVGGVFSSYDVTACPYVARLNSDGSLDTSFAQVGAGINYIVASVALQSDGRIVVGGRFTLYDTTPCAFVARLNTDGSLDPSFSSTGLNDIVFALAIQSDGRILLGGWFTSFAPTPFPHVVRLNTDGSLDTGFVPTGSGPNGYVYSLAVQSDGRILMGGSFTGYNGTSAPYLARINTGGSIDSGFAPNPSGFDGTVFSLALQSDGRVLAGGSFTSYNGSTRSRVARLSTDGSIDVSFVPTGTGLNNNVLSVASQSDGHVMVGGSFTTYNGVPNPRVARLSADGSLDTSFAQAGLGLDGAVNAIALQSDGLVLVGGAFTNYDIAARPYVARLNTDGTLDTGFAQAGSGLDGAVNAIAVQSDGLVLVGGAFTNYDIAARPYVARLNSDGTLDTSFALTGTGLNGAVNAIAVQSDGRVLVGGAFTSYNIAACPYVARLNSDGTLDTSFALTGTGLNGAVNAIAVQSDGRVLVGGAFTSYDGIARPYIARFNSDGSLDSDFIQTGTGLNGSVSSLATISGRILVGGAFSSYNNATAPNLNQLTSRGAWD